MRPAPAKGDTRAAADRAQREARYAALMARGLTLDAATGAAGAGARRHEPVTHGLSGVTIPVTRHEVRDGAVTALREQVAALEAEVAHLKRELAKRPAVEDGPLTAAQRAAAYRARRKGPT